MQRRNQVRLEVDRLEDRCTPSSGLDVDLARIAVPPKTQGANTDTMLIGEAKPKIVLVAEAAPDAVPPVINKP